VLGFVTEAATGIRAPLLHDIAAHVRLLVAVPVLLVLDHKFPVVCRHTIEHLLRFGFVRTEDRERFDRSLARATRLGDWWLPEAALVVLAIAIGIGALAGVIPIGGFAIRVTGLQASDYWYALVGLPLFEFLIFRSLWRWVLWVRFLVGLSRIRLDLDPTHPDKQAGISILRKPSLAYCAMLLFVASAVLSAEWGERFQFVTLASFLPVLLVAAVIGTLVAFGPLLLFVVQTYVARRDGLDALGGIAASTGRAFRDRWMNRPGDEVLASEEVQNLAALGGTYRDAVKAMRVVPLELRDVVIVLIATLVPVVPSILSQIPHGEWMVLASLLFSKSM
jgi:hypothetical protein